MVSSKPLPDVGDPYSARRQGETGDSAVRRRIPEYLTIATVLAPWGLKGEVKVRIETDSPDRFRWLRQSRCRAAFARDDCANPSDRSDSLGTR